MARYFHGGQKAFDSKEAGGFISGGMEAGNVPGKPTLVRIPPMFGGGTVPLKKEGIAFGFVGYSFWHLAPGEYVDLPDEIKPEHVKAKAPQLLTKEEAMEAGMCNEDGSPIRKAPAKAPRLVKEEPFKEHKE